MSQASLSLSGVPRLNRTTRARPHGTRRRTLRAACLQGMRASSTAGSRLSLERRARTRAIVRHAHSTEARGNRTTRACVQWHAVHSGRMRRASHSTDGRESHAWPLPTRNVGQERPPGAARGARCASAWDACAARHPGPCVPGHHVYATARRAARRASWVAVHMGRAARAFTSMNTGVPEAWKRHASMRYWGPSSKQDLDNRIAGRLRRREAPAAPREERRGTYRNVSELRKRKRLTERKRLTWGAANRATHTQTERQTDNG